MADFFFGGGEKYMENRSISMVTLSGDEPTVTCNNAVYDGKPHTGSFADPLGSKIRIKNSAPYIRVYSCASITDREHNETTWFYFWVLLKIIPREFTVLESDLEGTPGLLHGMKGIGAKVD